MLASFCGLSYINSDYYYILLSCNVWYCFFRHTVKAKIEYLFCASDTACVCACHPGRLTFLAKSFSASQTMRSAPFAASTLDGLPGVWTETPPETRVFREKLL